MSNKADVGDFENFLPSWISDHLGEKLYLANEVTQFPSSHRKDTPSPEVRPLDNVLSSIERETNTMS